jgi:hypothetical protein
MSKVTSKPVPKVSSKVAVVAVHGVADQKPSHSARSIADLLCSDPKGRFGAFTEVPLRVPRRPLEAGPPPRRPADDQAFAFMHTQLEQYEQHDAGATYDTVRLEGKKENGDTVHVHEVYWADLSRPGESWYRLIGELYQLVLHLPSLGRDTTDLAYEKETALRDGKPHPVWSITKWLQTWCVRLLTIPIPIVNLLILALTLVVLATFIPQVWQLAAAIGIAGAGAAAAWMFVPIPLLYRWIGLPFAGGIAAFAAWRAWSGAPSPTLYRVLGVEALVIGLAIVFVISAAYSKMRRGAKTFTAIGTLVTLILAWPLLRTFGTSAEGLNTAAVFTFNYLNLTLQYSWMAFTLLACAATIFGFVAIRCSQDRKRASRAMWTARFSLALPAALFVTTTVSLWLLITKSLAFVARDAKLLPTVFATNASLGDFLYAQVLEAAAQGLVVFIAGLAVFIAVAVFAVGPSIFYEIAHPRDDREATSTGRWLSRGIRMVALSGFIPTVSFFLLAIFGAMKYWPSWMREWAPSLLYGTSGAIAAVLTTKYFSSAFRGAVDVLLDVDNYLRKSPANATPRAQIAERYVSLLRHLCREDYDKIVIVAHSQGTVITADLLRHLKARPDRELKKLGTTIPLRLFTMGSPLRQLYAAAFPHLYAWIEDDEPLELASAAPWIGAKSRPLPQELFVEQWVNAYRTGDYVGRHLWSAQEARLYIRSTDPDDDGVPQRVQFCAGAGAHTHYWDRHAADIAGQLGTMV